MIAALADEGVDAGVREGLTGVWVDERKIASIGVHVSRGVTTHGFAVNVDNDLQPFEWVVPCGIEGVRMTSVAQETGRPGRPALLPQAAWRWRLARGARSAPAPRLPRAARAGRRRSPAERAATPRRCLA